MELWQRKKVRALRGLWNIVSLSAAAMTAWLAAPLSVLAQDNVVATATLPRDLSVQSMFLNANAVVQAVMIGLVFASVVTWAGWPAQTRGSLLGQAPPRAGAQQTAHLPPAPAARAQHAASQRRGAH